MSRKHYQREWRKRRAEIKALAESSSDEDSVDVYHLLQDDAETDMFEQPRTSGACAADLSTENLCDYEYNEDLPSSDSEMDILDNNPDVETDSVKPDMSHDLVVWAAKHKCTKESVNDLLSVLRCHGQDLPKDARTLLGTPRNVESIQKCNGKYIYLGLENALSKCLSQSESFYKNHSSINICVNIDGLPLYKSTNTQLWPILCNFPGFDPFVVALFCGTAKPDPVEDYLSDFIEEASDLSIRGVTFREKTFAFSIQAFVCDAPARALLKCIKGHTSYNSCERCVIQGSWEGRIVFNEAGTYDPRTDEQFSNMMYTNHQSKMSPLINAGICCITDFVLDYMHLVCLGVVRRLIFFLKKGPNICRLSVHQRQEISENLKSLTGCMPSEFARQPRGLVELERWKATELRQFILYTGPIVLKNVLPKEKYIHFLTLSVSLSIMLDSDNEKRNAYLPYAKDLIDDFVNRSSQLYGPTFCVYNVHSLTHIHEDVTAHGCSLNDISAFPFENYLRLLKRQVRNSNNPIAQVVKRMKECNGIQFHRKRIQDHAMYISIKPKDRCFLLNDESYAIIQEIRPGRMLLCDVIKQSCAVSFFKEPCDSKLINIAYLPSLRHKAERKLLHRKELYRKTACLPYKDGFVVLPLLHGIE